MSLFILYKSSFNLLNFNASFFLSNSKWIAYGSIRLAKFLTDSNASLSKLSVKEIIKKHQSQIKIISNKILKINNLIKKKKFILLSLVLFGRSTFWPLEVVVLTLTLKKNTLHNYRNIIEEFPQTDWDEFDKKSRLRDQIANIKQTSNFDDYLNRFKNIAGQLNEISQEFKMQCFIKGLQSKKKTYVKLQNPKTFEDAIYMATRSEELLGYNNHKVMMSAKTHNRDKSLVCRNCKKVGHIA
ncbi:hypothetical protein BpHYR1_043347 [Brachionus plicatilis]|uniref:Retrotransposon gag domain-containing protein n=1 Tax=Brachionus plicatilis TaxID=10195 RepID=A0A3M7RMK1_BRAPC|nr:hypothetical protein BpHYR1_043347 [Brachionus plicatilis]